MSRYSGWMNVRHELLREEEIDIVCDSCTRVITQKVDIEIPKDRDLFIKHRWVGQNFLQVFRGCAGVQRYSGTEGFRGCAWMVINAAKNIIFAFFNFNFNPNQLNISAIFA